jgi:uncharacterized protein (TIGR03118 family)
MRHWLLRLYPARSRTRTRPGRQARPLTLEHLEDRRLLAGFTQTDLVSDIPGMAAVTDPHLINPWGISLGPTTAFWVSDNRTGVSTLYDGNGQAQPLVVTIPASASAAPGAVGSPTGTVFNGGTGFVVKANGKSGAALFLFASLDGTISGWNPNVDPTHALLAVDANGASYTGLALASNGGSSFLYAANFRAGTIDVYDQAFHKASLAGDFSDPSLPAGFAPFNVKALNGNLFVEYARQDRTPTGGFVDVYGTDGRLLRRLASGGPLNAPWGVTIAPAHFGAFGGAVLVGNFGDGKINAFDATSGAFLGTLTDAAGHPLVNDHLWALTVGNGGAGGDPNSVYLAAGIQNEAHGLFARLTPAAAAPGADAALTVTGQSVQATPGVAFSAPVATLRDADPAATAAGFTATITWGDGSAPSAGQVSADGSGGFRVVGSHTYAAAGTFSTAVTVTDTDTSHDPGGSTATGSGHAVVGSANQAYLAKLYQDLLGRGVDPVGLATWGGQLDGGASRDTVVQQIENSDEFRAREVNALYARLLGRQADPLGLRVWTGVLANGGGEQQVEAQILGSDEFFAAHGATATGFLQALYQDTFQATLDPLGASVWGSDLAGGATRGAVAAAVLASPAPATFEVQGLYQQFLHRAADSVGLNFFGGQLQAGVPEEQVVRGLVSSDEYVGRAA